MVAGIVLARKLTVLPILGSVIVDTYARRVTEEMGRWYDFLQVLHNGNGSKPRNGQEVTIRVIDRKLGIDSVEKQTFVLGFSMVIDG